MDIEIDDNYQEERIKKMKRNYAIALKDLYDMAGMCYCKQNHDNITANN